jgi:hypothetical protein
MQARYQVGLGCLAALVGALSLGAHPAAAQQPFERSSLEQRHRAEVRVRYAQSSWPRGGVQRGLPTALKLDGWSTEDVQSERGLLTRSFRRAETDEAAAFVLETFVADSVEQAQERLLDWLASAQALQRAPSTRESGLLIGDIGFVGRRGTDAAGLAWIAFVRGNAAVRVRACQDPSESTRVLDLAAIARAVDREAIEAPLQEDGAPPPKPQIRSFTSTRSAARAGEALQLELDIVDPDGAVPHLQWVIGGPGQGYVERSKAGVWEFHTTGPGAATLRVEVTGSNGTFAQAELHFELADDE